MAKDSSVFSSHLDTSPPRRTNFQFHELFTYPVHPFAMSSSRSTSHHANVPSSSSSRPTRPSTRPLPSSSRASSASTERSPTTWARSTTPYRAQDRPQGRSRSGRSGRSGRSSSGRSSSGRSFSGRSSSCRSSPGCSSSASVLGRQPPANSSSRRSLIDANSMTPLEQPLIPMQNEEMPPTAQNEQRSLLQDACEILLFTLRVIVVYPVVIVLVMVFVAGPSLYYRETVVNSNKLTAKYCSEGIPVQGRISKRWIERRGDNGPTYFIIVEYKGDLEGESEIYYSKELIVPKATYDLEAIDLTCLPGYPKSAVLRDTLQGFDGDIPPSKMPRLICSFILVGFANCFLWVLILFNIESCPYCPILIGPVVFVSITIGFLISYPFVRNVREQDLRSKLFGAKKNPPETEEDIELSKAQAKSITYSEFLDESPPTFLQVIVGVFTDLLLVLSLIPLVAYFIVFGGGHLALYNTLFSSKRRKTFDTFMMEGSSRTIGSVVARRPPHTIVQYEVQSRTYKKAVRAGYWGVAVSDRVELIHLRDRPTSAELKYRIDRRAEEFAINAPFLLACVIVMAVQIGLPVLFLGDFVPFHHGGFAGILLAAHLILGCISSYIQYRYVFLRDVVHGGKAVHAPCPTRSHDTFVGNSSNWNEDESAPGVAAISRIEDTNITAPEPCDNVKGANDYVSTFMAGKFPRLEKAFPDF